MSQAHQIWVGTSGFTYSDWVGPFYPKDLVPFGVIFTLMLPIPGGKESLFQNALAEVTEFIGSKESLYYLSL
jgi:hypothetical protein